MMTHLRSIAIVALAACTPANPSPAPSPTTPPRVPAADASVVVPIVADAAIADRDASVPADAAVAAADAGAGPTACTAGAIARVRKQADVEVAAGRYDAAIALLRGGDCYLQAMDQPEALQAQIAWQLSDLAYAYYKAGRIEACYGIAAAQLAPYSGNVGQVFGEEEPVMKALAHNAALCQAAAAKQRGTFVKSIPCALDQDAGYGLPAQLLKSDERAACLFSESGGKDADGLLDCGKVVLVTQARATGKTTRTVLKVERGNLVDSSVCCNVRSVRFGERGATWAVLVESEGRDCNGGTASSEEQHVYELNGTKLQLTHTLDAIAH